ncbi:MAG: YfhO family protein [Flexilinea sp.]|nr:YfhO family protein [Flexilinea sp.]
MAMNSQTDRNRSKNRYLPVAFSFFCAVGILFLLNTFYAGPDDKLAFREGIVLGICVFIVWVITLLISGDLPVRTVFMALLSAFFASTALNFEFTDLMKLPVQLPAENAVRIDDLDDEAVVSMTWGYWFRPRTQNADPFLTNPDRDISFSRLIRNGVWDDELIGDERVLSARDKGASLGIPVRFRTQLAVLCFKVSSGTAAITVKGEKSPLIITQEMTSGQPYRIILKNGLLPETCANIFQILLWSAALFFLFLCGIELSKRLSSIIGIRKNLLICICSFLIPCLILVILCIILKITPFGEKSFLINDMWGEYADYMAYFRSVISGENDLFYSFSMSLGNDMLPLLAFYVINPLNWLVCLFKAEDLPDAITMLVILRYGICGLTAAVYFVRRRNCGFSALLFSVCYALMSFNVVNAENTNLRESAMVLPLIILGLEKLVDDGSCRCYIWALAAGIFLNFYSGYQICIFAALYFLYYCYLSDGLWTFRKKILKFGIASFLAVGITAVLLLPVVIQLREGPKSFDPSVSRMQINMPWHALFGKLFASAYDVHQIENGFPNLYIGVLCAMLLSLEFVNPQIPGRKKALDAGLLTVCIVIMQLRPLDLALHGFSAPLWWPYRYSFIICFFMLVLASDSLAAYKCRNRTGLAMSLGMFLGLAVLLSISKFTWMSEESLKLNVTLAAAFAMLLSFAFYRRIPFSIVSAVILTMLELFLNASHIFSINTAFERSNTVSDYAAYYAENQPVIDKIRNDDVSFYRVEKTYSRTPNDPMLLGYNGITHYSSTLAQKTMDFLERVGFRHYPPYRILYWEGSDIAMDSLLGIRYLVSGMATTKPYSSSFSYGVHTVYKNPYALPLMFTASIEALAETDPDENTFEYQNRIFSLLTGEEVNIFIPAESEMMTPDGLTEASDAGEICYLREEAGQGDLTWKIRATRDDTLYAFFPAEDLHPSDLFLNNRKIGSYFDNFSYHIFRLGNFQPGEEIILKMVPAEEEVCLSSALFYYEDLSALETQVSILREDRSDLQKINSSHLKGTFSASSDKLLFLTIPYSSGWTIRIDGEKLPVYKAADIFMAVNVSEGDHTVELDYQPAGLVCGLCISLLAVIMTAFFCRKNKVFRTN